MYGIYSIFHVYVVQTICVVSKVRRPKQSASSTLTWNSDAPYKTETTQYLYFMNLEYAVSIVNFFVQLIWFYF